MTEVRTSATDARTSAIETCASVTKARVPENEQRSLISCVTNVYEKKSIQTQSGYSSKA
jgi:hypothetical protein